MNAVEPESLLTDGGSATGGRVTLADGQRIEYDWLVLALGSETSTFGIPGARELAIPFCTYNDALKVGLGSRCSTRDGVQLQNIACQFAEDLEILLHNVHVHLTACSRHPKPCCVHMKQRLGDDLWHERGFG